MGEVAQQVGDDDLGPQRSQQALHMHLVLGLEDELDFGVFDRHVEEQAVVLHVPDIGALLRDDARGNGEPSRRVAGLKPDPHQLAVMDEGAHECGREDGRIYIAAGNHQPNFAAFEQLRIGQKSSQRGCTRPFRHDFADSGQFLDAPFQVISGDQQDVLDMFLNDGTGQLAGIFDRDTFGYCRAAWWDSTRLPPRSGGWTN